MICPRCGERNPDNYRFCGMCGDALRGPAASEGASDTAASKAQAENMAFSRMENRGSGKTATIAPPAPRPAVTALHVSDEPVSPIAGPSLLGLNTPTPDSIRETTFRGMTTYYPEERHPAWGRIFLTLIFIAGLVAVGWWRYKNYGFPGTGKPPSWLSAMNRTTPPSDNQSPQFGNKPADQSANQNSDQAKNDTSKNQASDQKDASAAGENAAAGQNAASGNQTSDSAATANQKSAGSEKTAESKSADNSSGVAAAEKPSSKSAKSTDENDQGDEAESAPQKPAKAARRASTRGGNAATKPSAGVADNAGDALFRKGEAYLYGRGVSENCAQAVQYLKSASAKSNAKARSTFGTMYATGHCVPRDLPSSYRWFALALQADPSNSILEKDLTAVWNQMTPPERQLATKLKPAGE